MLDNIDYDVSRAPSAGFFSLSDVNDMISDNRTMTMQPEENRFSLNNHILPLSRTYILTNQITGEWRINSMCGRYIYHLSIIDCLQEYDLKKQVERYSKILKMKILKGKSRDGYGKDFISSINPSKYKERFHSFCKRTVFANTE